MPGKFVGLLRRTTARLPVEPHRARAVPSAKPGPTSRSWWVPSGIFGVPGLTCKQVQTGTWTSGMLSSGAHGKHGTQFVVRESLVCTLPLCHRWRAGSRLPADKVELGERNNAHPVHFRFVLRKNRSLHDSTMSCIKVAAGQRNPSGMCTLSKPLRGPTQQMVDEAV
jgi:hypothetical protein